MSFTDEVKEGKAIDLSKFKRTAKQKTAQQIIDKEAEYHKARKPYCRVCAYNDANSKRHSAWVRSGQRGTTDDHIAVTLALDDYAKLSRFDITGVREHKQPYLVDGMRTHKMIKFTTFECKKCLSKCTIEDYKDKK